MTSRPRPMQRQPRAHARRLPALPRDPDALDGQRHVRPREQRHLLFVFRHGRERAPDPRRRPRHPQRRRSSGFVVETSCRFHRPLSFPETIDAGLRVAQLGTQSVTLRDRAVSRRDERRAGRDRPLRARLGRSRDASARRTMPAHIRAALAAAGGRARPSAVSDADRCIARAMTAATRDDARALLGAFLDADAHYRASAAVYGDGGAAGARPRARPLPRPAGNRLRLARARASDARQARSPSAHAWSAARSRRRAARWSPSSTT